MLEDFRTDVSVLHSQTHLFGNRASCSSASLTSDTMPYTGVDETLRVLDCNALLKKHRQVLQITRRTDLELVHGNTVSRYR